MTKEKPYNNNKKNHAIPEIRTRDTGFKVHQISTTLWRPMHFTDKNNQYMLKL